MRARAINSLMRYGLLSVGSSIPCFHVTGGGGYNESCHLSEGSRPGEMERVLC